MNAWVVAKDMSDAYWRDVLEVFQRPSRNAVVQYVLYHNPKDSPSPWVIRRWEVSAHGSHDCEAYGFQSEDAARSCVPVWAYRIGRMPHDDAAIVDVWT